MTFKEVLPGQYLKPYVKCFYFYESNSELEFEDIVFPSGNMEVIFNLGSGVWKTRKEDTFQTTPPIELWGQLTQPLAVKSVGRNVMLGVRFYPHSAAYFFDATISELNNEVVNASDLFGGSIQSLHQQLFYSYDLGQRIALLENYLRGRLAFTEKKHKKIQFVESIANNLKTDVNPEKIVSISSKHKISTRYLNQLFSQYTGLTPKLFYKINRFQKSLHLMNDKEQPLTDIGYESGYFDQSHFIREFKLFTGGFTPSSFTAQTLPINQILVAN